MSFFSFLRVSRKRTNAKKIIATHVANIIFALYFIIQNIYIYFKDRKILWIFLYWFFKINERAFVVVKYAYNVQFPECGPIFDTNCAIHNEIIHSSDGDMCETRMINFRKRDFRVTGVNRLPVDHWCISTQGSASTVSVNKCRRRAALCCFRPRVSGRFSPIAENRKRGLRIRHEWLRKRFCRRVKLLGNNLPWFAHVPSARQREKQEASTRDATRDGIVCIKLPRVPT